MKFQMSNVAYYVKIKNEIRYNTNAFDKAIKREKIMANIDVKLEAWKNKLLDLGKRNRLINYRDTKRSNLRIKIPQIFDLWDSLVVNENPLEFPYIDEEAMDFENEDSNDNFYSVITNQTIKEQQKTLRSLREKAKTAVEEQGVNILYLSFGFLKWKESINSEQYLTSPIILVPVSLTIESISDPYVLNLHEDEIVINPTLKYKLENDYGIILPEFIEDESIVMLYEQIRKLILKNEWEVIEDVGLSLFSFLKINMYNDIEKHKDKIKLNLVVRSLCGDAGALNHNIEEINDFDHDRRTKPVDVFQVVDADSSQQDAIVCAKKGVSFVLQGPPGTGKSQTITNIIAECIADGKKVLFVSEKMAALDVVHRRLTNAGLADFCLTLHSHKANKKEILEQLGSVLTLSHKKANLSDEVFQKLDLLQTDKENLNQYSEAIFTKVSPFEKTIYEVNGYLANLQSYEDIVFSLQNVDKVSYSQFNRYITLLTQFIDTVGKMSDDYKSNPWNSANVLNVSNELRHDIGANLNKLIYKVKEASKLFDEIEKEFELDYSSSYKGLTDLIVIFKIAAMSPKVPMQWIIGEDIFPLFAEIDEYSNSKKQFDVIKNELTDAYSKINNNDSKSYNGTAENLFKSSQINDATSMWNEFISNNYLYSNWNHSEDFNLINRMFITVKEKVIEYNSIKTELLSNLEKEIFEIDYKAILSRYKTDYNSIFKIFNKQYKIDKNQVIGKYKDFVKKLDDATVKSILLKLRQIDELSQWFNQNNTNYAHVFGELYKAENTVLIDIEKALSAYSYITIALSKLAELLSMAVFIEEKANLLKSHFDYLYDGFNTDWETILKSLNWANDFRKMSEKNNLCKLFIEKICTDSEKIGMCGQLILMIENTIQDIDIEFSWFLNLFDDKDRLENTNMPVLCDRLEKCLNGLSLLEEWIDFRNARENCKTEGLQDYIDKIQKMQLDVSHIIPVFKKRFYRLWLDLILPNYPSVMNFRRRIHEETIDEFAKLDRLQFDIAKARIKKKLIDNLPTLDRFTNGADEISILKRELGKQRRIMPLRKLFTVIPNLLLTLKPCLMMSPLSVSLFLESESYNFDVVIFDEASQVCTENAIGAISRAKQVIIAGDSKQLPPTNFFAASISDSEFDTDDEDEYDDVNSYESILDEAVMLPERTLLWHYRSRHEHLIAFSNTKIYKNNLVTFPSNVDKVSDNGVEYFYVSEGFYDKGGKKGNVIEAQKVAEMVFHHFRRNPNRSLGVITFGETQQRAIDTAIRYLRLKDQSYEHFFKDDVVEEFFIKNLENVQGDERDTIIFSIGYARPSQGGQMQMQFGPLSKSGGERRLNVAITRAKHNVKLVGSIMPTDIDLNRITTEGPKLLRSYIDFAINGPSAILKEITDSDLVEHDSPFEAAVYNYLDRKGYKVGTQVGCSGYRIDMAVKHPTLSGRFVLGIECDGASYHSARTARERDRLRQDVLENMGWKIYRIWSTDWIKDPITEGEKLIAVVDKAISEYVEDSPNNYEEIASDNEKEFITIDKKDKTREMTGNPYGFVKIEPTQFDKLSKDRSGYVDLGDCIKAVVENEYPAHYDFLCKSLASLFGNEKATVKVRNQVDYKIKELESVVIRKGDFLFPTKYNKISARCNNTRPINYISVDELAEVLLCVAKICVGATFDSLCTESARAYGYNRMGDKISFAMQNAYKQLLDSDKIREIEGKVVVR